MSLGEGGGESGLGFETLEGYSWPTVTQFSVFLENRVGQLLELVRSFTGTKVRIVGLSIADSADCCIVRIMLSHSEQGREILQHSRLPYAENELIVAELTAGSRTLSDICAALLQGEVNIHYAYPLIVHPHGRAAVAMHIDNVELAGQILRSSGFEVLSESDLRT
ncbi:acetolactate synthase [Tautonia sociabilis]|uniref:Acetolactate synthase n=1 Tax=Tautonia sociabilis TaxID=2080755 RepID=A0A432MMU6_9BACT|nr:acetolactate synthase [Tautonia sociabilis]RUL88569.1 acetolactate synthase [Tautonia sociabilis]